MDRELRSHMPCGVAKKKKKKAVGIQRRWRAPLGREQGHWGLSQGFTEDLAFVCKFKNG